MLQAMLRYPEIYTKLNFGEMLTMILENVQETQFKLTRLETTEHQHN